jgi:hypothetical protein
VHQEPYRRVAFRQAAPPTPRKTGEPPDVPYTNPEYQPQLVISNGHRDSVPPPPLRVDEPTAQRPEIATFTHDAGAVAHGLATARRIPSIHPAKEPAEEVLQLEIDEETTFNE